MKLTFRKLSTNESCEVESTPGMLLPKANDHIVSPFQDGKMVTVAEVVHDAPRNCFQVFLAD
jgi:hypothetical protein